MGPWRLGRGDLLGHSSCQTNPTSQSRAGTTSARRCQPPGWPRSLPGPRVQKPAWRGLSGGVAGAGPLPVLPGWRAGGGQQRGAGPSAWVPAQVGRSGSASGPAPGGPAAPPPLCGPSCGPGWARGGLASSGGGWQLQFLLRPGPGGVGMGWRTLSSQYGEGGREHRCGEGGPLARKTRPEPGAGGAQGLGGCPPACPRGSWRCGPGRAGGGGPGGAAAGGGEGVRRGLGPPCPLRPQTRGSVSPWGGRGLFASVSQATWGVAGPAPIRVPEVP